MTPSQHAEMTAFAEILLDIFLQLPPQDRQRYETPNRAEFSDLTAQVHSIQ